MCNNASGNGSGNCHRDDHDQKTPKRGPGVANLEKILRKDKENKTDHLDHHHHYQQVVQHQPFLTKINPTNINNNYSLTTNMNHASLLQYYDNITQNKTLNIPHSFGNSDLVFPNNNNNNNIHEGNYKLDQYGISFPSISLWPPPPSPPSLPPPSPSPPPPPPSLMLNKQFYQSNQFHSKINHGIPVSTSSNSSRSSSIPLYPNQILEPPSTFASDQYNYLPMVSEDKKLVGQKRRLVSLAVDNLPTPVFQYQVHSTLPHIQRPDKSSFNNNLLNKYKPLLSKITVPSQTQSDGTLKPMINFQNFSIESEPGNPDFIDAHFHRSVPPNVDSQPFQISNQERAPSTDNYKPLFQGSTVEIDSHKKSKTGGSDVKDKPFYSFMQVKEQGTKEKPICIDKDEDESPEENIGIDLNLKL